MQIARYPVLQHGADAGDSTYRRRATPAERVLEGELLPGERREGRERRNTAAGSEPPSRPPPPVDAPPRMTPGNGAIAAYLRAADATGPARTTHIHLVV